MKVENRLVYAEEVECLICGLDSLPWEEEVQTLVNSLTTVDAMEVVHGKWVPGYPVSCSVCGGAAATDYEDANRYDAWLSPYCPNCGAHMCN